MAGICKTARALLNIPYMIRIGNTYSNRNYCSKFNPSNPTMYDSRKFSPCLPVDGVILPFMSLKNVPTGVFRCTSGEILGPCASNKAVYKNPEYFSHHNMTFFDFHHVMKEFRMKQPNSGRKPISF